MISILLKLSARRLCALHTIRHFGSWRSQCGDRLVPDIQLQSTCLGLNTWLIQKTTCRHSIPRGWLWWGNEMWNLSLTYRKSVIRSMINFSHSKGLVKIAHCSSEDLWICTECFQWEQQYVQSDLMTKVIQWQLSVHPVVYVKKLH